MTATADVQACRDITRGEKGTCNIYSFMLHQPAAKNNKTKRLCLLLLLLFFCLVSPFPVNSRPQVIGSARTCAARN